MTGMFPTAARVVYIPDNCLLDQPRPPGEPTPSKAQPQVVTMANTSWSGTRRSFPRRTRIAILQRDPICAACHRAPSTIADHIVPHAEGGTDTTTNGQGLCSPCHHTKTTAEQARGRARRGTHRRRPPEKHPGLKS